MNESRPAIQQRNHTRKNESNNGTCDAKGRDVSKCRVGNHLSAPSAHEVDVRDQDGDPGQDTEDGHERDEIRECFESADVWAHEGDAAARTRQRQSVNRDATIIGAAEDAWSVAFDSKGVEGAGCNVEIRVGGGEGED